MFMFEVKIYRLDDNTLQAIQHFSTLEEALLWIKNGNELGWWKTDSTKEGRANTGNEQQGDAFDSLQENAEQRETGHATHRYEIIDITSRVVEQQMADQCMQNRQIGLLILDAINVEFVKYQFDINKLYAILLDPDYVFISRLLQLGYLQYAREYLQNKEGKFIQLLGGDFSLWLKDQICQACSKLSK